MKTTFTLAALLLAGAAGAQGQQVWRCGNTYSQQPCEGAALVKVDDTRSVQQSAAAAAESRREAKAADAMEKERHQLEAKAAPATVIQQAKAAPEPREPRSADDRKKPKKQAKKPEYFTAVGPKPAKDAGKKKKPVKSA